MKTTKSKTAKEIQNLIKQRSNADRELKKKKRGEKNKRKPGGHRWCAYLEEPDQERKDQRRRQSQSHGDGQWSCRA